MSLSDQPDVSGESRRFMDRPIVRVCDQCERVQDGLTAAEPEQWSDQATYMAARGFTLKACGGTTRSVNRVTLQTSRKRTQVLSESGAA